MDGDQGSQQQQQPPVRMNPGHPQGAAPQMGGMLGAGGAPRPKTAEILQLEALTADYRAKLVRFTEIKTQQAGQPPSAELVALHKALTVQLNQIKDLQKILESQGLIPPQQPRPQGQPGAAGGQPGQPGAGGAQGRPPVVMTANPQQYAAAPMIGADGRPILHARPPMRPNMIMGPGQMPVGAMAGRPSFPGMTGYPAGNVQVRRPPPAGIPAQTDTLTFAAPVDTTPRPIFHKRKIQELVAQIDPREKMDPEVEDVLLEIADDFIESVTTFGCMLAKHRKSETLEVKDIQLHLEKNWNIKIPGFAGDEIKPLKKPTISDAHKQRLILIKKASQKEGKKH